MEEILVAAQCLNIAASFWITKRLVTYLVLSNVIVLFNLIGSLMNENAIYHSIEASLFLVLFAFLLNAGAYMCDLLKGGDLKRYLKVEPRVVSAGAGRREVSTKILVAAMGGFFLITLYFFYSKGIPLFMDDLKYARKEVQEDAFIYYRFFLHFMPITTLILYSRYCVHKESKAGYYFVLCFVLLSVTLFLLGYKGYLLWYAVLVLMMINLYNENIYKNIALMAGLGFFGGVVVTSYMYSISIEEALYFFVVRATQISAYGYNILFYEYYPYAARVNELPSNLNTYLAEWKYGVDSNMAEYSMGLTITIVGALILYLGKFGAMVAALLLGALMQLIYVVMVKMKCSPLFVTFLLYVTYIFVGVVNRGTTVTVLTQPVVSLIAISLLYMVATMVLGKSHTYAYSVLK